MGYVIWNWRFNFVQGVNVWKVLVWGTARLDYSLLLVMCGHWLNSSIIWQLS